ncbi:dUTP diphosphatase [Candidatus Woesearchaeota archaeon]|jgi:dUTP pyrophosphatase|nr:dUTP diphosphatase [Candidatus Woesearchaeota archaeon]MBT5740568.1 dUTP diphosphatase [Candidatus Woesearchaeota archaeon]
MKVRIKRIDNTLPLPKYKTEGAAAFDMYARETTTVPALGQALVPSNFIIETPPSYALLISARSSISRYFPGLFLSNAPGIIDSDYCGDTDEIFIAVYNYSNKDIMINKGERFAQGRFNKVETAEWEEVEEMKNKDRSGYGSTGVN